VFERLVRNYVGVEILFTFCSVRQKYLWMEPVRIPVLPLLTQTRVTVYFFSRCNRIRRSAMWTCAALQQSPEASQRQPPEAFPMSECRSSFHTRHYRSVAARSYSNDIIFRTIEIWKAKRIYRPVGILYRYAEAIHPPTLETNLFLPWVLATQHQQPQQ
jgi:hypothetical protein